MRFKKFFLVLIIGIFITIMPLAVQASNTASTDLTTAQDLQVKLIKLQDLLRQYQSLVQSRMMQNEVLGTDLAVNIAMEKTKYIAGEQIGFGYQVKGDVKYPTKICFTIRNMRTMTTMPWPGSVSCVTAEAGKEPVGNLTSFKLPPDGSYKIVATVKDNYGTNWKAYSEEFTIATKVGAGSVQMTWPKNTEPIYLESYPVVHELMRFDVNAKKNTILEWIEVDIALPSNLGTSQWGDMIKEATLIIDNSYSVGMSGAILTGTSVTIDGSVHPELRLTFNLDKDNVSTNKPVIFKKTGEMSFVLNLGLEADREIQLLALAPDMIQTELVSVTTNKKEYLKLIPYINTKKMIGPSRLLYY